MGKICILVLGLTASYLLCPHNIAFYPNEALSHSYSVFTLSLSIQMPVVVTNESNIKFFPAVELSVYVLQGGSAFSF